MKMYALIFRMDITTESAQPSPEQMKIYMRDWMKWLDSISAKGQLAEGGNHFSYKSARVIRSGNAVSEGPYVANKESVAGYILVFANDLDGAAELAKACPILQGEGNSVEVRETESPG